MTRYEFAAVISRALQNWHRSPAAWSEPWKNLQRNLKKFKEHPDSELTEFPAKIIIVAKRNVSAATMPTRKHAPTAGMFTAAILNLKNNI